MYGSQLVAHAETFEELGENDKALNEKLVAHAERIAGVSKASIKRDDEIKLAIAPTASAAKPGAAQEQEWMWSS